MSVSSLGRNSVGDMIKGSHLDRSFFLGTMIVIALLAFEIFNYSTTDYALTDLLGDLKFLGLRWATILSIAFCGIDFAGLARLFSSDEKPENYHEVWYLFGAWLLAATMNALLTWWGVSIAIINHTPIGNTILGGETLLRVAPIFVAVLVWLIRIFIIGTLSASNKGLNKIEEQFTGRKPLHNHRPSSISAMRSPQPSPLSAAPGGYARATYQHNPPTETETITPLEARYHSLLRMNAEKQLVEDFGASGTEKQYPASVRRKF